MDRFYSSLVSNLHATTKILARQLVRLRKNFANLQGSRAQMRGIHAQFSVASGLKGATKGMSVMNKQMAAVTQMKTLHEFQRQSAQMDMTTEIISNAINDALDNDEADEETDELTN
ncbi:Vacuolar protein sorting-associated protein 2-like protein 3 [Bienertia sinuspersici]